MGLANLLTAARLLLIPLFVGLLIYGKYGAGTFVFVLAGATDALDGLAARHFNQKSRLGAFLDPVADKLLAVSSFVTLSLRGPIPVWFVVIVISRDVMISLGSLILYLSEGSLEVAPSLLGKATTFLQFLTILVALLHLLGGLESGVLTASLMASALFTALSGVHYLYRGLVARDG